MATPHVAGAAALYLQGSPRASPATVSTARSSSTATTGVVTGPGTGSPNRLLYSLLDRRHHPAADRRQRYSRTRASSPARSSWTATSGVITNATRCTGADRFVEGVAQRLRHQTTTDTLSQNVTIAAGIQATLSFDLFVSSAETTTTTAYDRLQVAGRLGRHHHDAGHVLQPRTRGRRTCSAASTCRPSRGRRRYAAVHRHRGRQPGDQLRHRRHVVDHGLIAADERLLSSLGIGTRSGTRAGRATPALRCARA